MTESQTTMRSAQAWLSIWCAQPGWSEEWMLKFIQDVQDDARRFKVPSAADYPRVDYWNDIP